MKNQVANNLKLLLFLVLLLSAFTLKNVVKDYNGNEYKVTDIGGTTWMAENLNTDQFRNGDTIPQAATTEAWAKAAESEQPAWCYAENNTENGAKYGKLYNWFAVNDPRGLAPDGWHIPSDAEWIEMENFIGGRNTAGIKMKNTKDWGTNDQGTNESGFSGLPGGILRVEDKIQFEKVGSAGYWWSSTAIMGTKVFIRILESENEASRRFFVDKKYGVSVRCIKDK